MSDEEKKAIKILKVNPEIIADLDEEMFEKMCEFKEKSIKELKYWASQTALNLIEKQSKEIESLKEENKKKSIVIIEYQDLYEKLEDKIKAKIEEYKKKIKKMEKDDVGIGFTLGKEWSDLKAKVEFGQSLLEKE